MIIKQALSFSTSRDKVCVQFLNLGQGLGIQGVGLGLFSLIITQLFGPNVTSLMNVAFALAGIRCHLSCYL